MLFICSKDSGLLIRILPIANCGKGRLFVFWFFDAKETETEAELKWLKEEFDYDGVVIASINATSKYSNRI